MKKILASALLMLSAAAAMGQANTGGNVPYYGNGGGGILNVSVAPSGSCSSSQPVTQKTPDGTLYTCQNGTWAQVNGNGGTGPIITSPNRTLTIGGSGTSTITADTSNTLNYADSYTAPCTVGGTTYTNTLSCAFYSTIAAGGSEIILGPKTYTTEVGLVEPTLGTQISLLGQVEGYNGLPTRIQATAPMQAIISHPDILTSQSSPYNLRIENIAFDGNNLAQQCIALYAEKLSVRRDLTCRNYTSTGLAPIQFGDNNPPNGYQSGGYQNFTEHVFVQGAGTGPYATISVAQTGGIPAITVSSGGTYVNANPPVYFFGFQQTSVGGSSSSNKPCTTMGTSTANMTGTTPPYSVSSVTMTGYSGCSGMLYAYIPDIGPADYGFEEAETDSHFFDIEVANAGDVAGIHYSSGSNFIGGDHAYGGMPVDFLVTTPQKAIVGLEPDTPNYIGIEDDSGKNVYTSTEFVTPNLGAVGFFATSGAISILGSTCGQGSISSNNFTLMVTSSGAVSHGFGAVYPGEVIGATQCDNLSKVNFIPQFQAQGIQIVGGGNIAASSGTVNAVQFFLSSGIQMRTTNPANPGLVIINNSPAPTADLLDFQSGSSSTQVASVDASGGGHFQTITAAAQATAANWRPGTTYSAAGTALPTCNSGNVGTQYVVSDATAFGGAYTSGGTITASVICSYSGSAYSYQVQGGSSGSSSSLYKGYAVDSGSANAYVVSLTDASYTGATAGAFFYAKFINASSAASTITINGGATRPIHGFSTTAAQTGTIAGNAWYFCFDDGTNINVSPVAGSQILRMPDGNLQFFNGASPTKQFQFSGQFVTAGNTRVISVPDATVTMAAINLAQTYTAAQTFPLLNPSATQTTVSCSTSGSAIFSQPFQGSSDKKVLIHLAACVGTASYTFPVAYTNTPSVFASNNVASSIATSVSTTAVTVTGATTTGALILEDY